MCLGFQNPLVRYILHKPVSQAMRFNLAVNGWLPPFILNTPNETMVDMVVS